MAEQDTEHIHPQPNIENSKKVSDVIAVTIDVTKRIGAVIGKVSREIFGIIFK